MTRYAAKYRRVARSLSRVGLMRSSMDDTFTLSDFDLDDRESRMANPDRLFLDFYGDSGLELALERYGIFDALRRRGWGELSIETHAHDDRHTLLVDGTDAEGEKARLFELVVRRDQLRIEGFDRRWESLTIDWLGLRNPRGEFTERRLRLPGQDAPGLGIGERVLELLYRVVDRLKLDGLLTVAEHFHLAVLYARELVFVDPFFAGQLGALTELLFGREQLSFAQAAWAVHWGCVRELDDSVLSWRGEAMVNARDEQLKTLLAGAEYRERAAEISRTRRYSLARAEFDQRWTDEHDALLRSPGPGEVRP